MFQDWVRCISNNLGVSSTLWSCIAKCTAYGCQTVTRYDELTADDDVLQTPKQTGTVRTGMMVPCRVHTERHRHTVWTWCDQRHPANVERHVEDASDHGRISGCLRWYVQLHSWLAAACQSMSLVHQQGGWYNSRYDSWRKHARVWRWSHHQACVKLGVTVWAGRNISRRQRRCAAPATDLEWWERRGHVRRWRRWWCHTL